MLRVRLLRRSQRTAEKGLMDLAPILPWLGGIALILSLGNTIITFLTSGSTANADAISKLSTRVGDTETRLQNVESELKHLPDQQAVHRLELTLKDMQIEISRIASSAEQSARTSTRVEQYLLERGK
jgi:hypothetical protein